MDASFPLAPMLLLLLPLVLLHAACASADGEHFSSLRQKRAAKGFTLAFVFDSTNSMRDELNQVKQAMQEIFDYMQTNRTDEIENYALVEFNDPDARLLTITTNAKVYRDNLNKIRVHGGGDCPEMAMKGIKLALEKSLPNSYLFVFTDASAKDYKNKAEVENLIQRKKSKVVFVLTGKCKGDNEPGYKAYYDVASVSNGRVFNLQKNEVTKVLQFVKEDTARKNIISKGKINGKRVIVVPVDPSMKKVTGNVEGDGSRIDFTDANGKKVDSRTLLKVNSAISKEVVNPKPGNLTVTMETKKPGYFDITAEDTFNFIYGFSVKPSKSIAETAPRPLIGKETSLLIQISNQSNLIQLTDVKIKDVKGNLLKTMKLRAMPGKNDTYNAELFLPPTSVFFLEVSGKDSKNNKIIRLLDSGISPQQPDPPIITLKSELTATLKTPFTLTCHVESLVPFIGSWFKGSVNVMPDKNFIQSAQVLYNISETELSSAGEYTCKAKNAAGSASKSVKLKVQGLPPSVKTPKTVELQFNKTGEIPCHVGSHVGFTVTWTKKGSAGSVQKISGSKFTTKPTGNLVISPADISDEGEYHCSAKNAFGSSEDRISVKVTQPVQVVAKADKLKFRSQDKFNLTCSASGSDPITLVWKKNGIIIQDSDKRLAKPDQKQLILRMKFAQESDAGTYECEASNKINKASQSLELKYTEQPGVKIHPSSSPPLVGKPYTLECLITGSPKPTVSWTKDRKKILSKDFEQVLPNGTLIIPQLFFNHTGNYQCIAKNELGNASANVNIDVISAPWFDSDKEALKVDVKKNVSLICKVHGNPEPKFKWERKDGKPISERFSKSSSCSMNLIGALPQDEGTYVVTATNKFGMHKKHFKLFVTGLVKPILAYGKSEESTIVGQQKELSCSIQRANPLPTFTWSKDGKKLETKDLNDMKGRIFANGSLIISYIKPTDESTYVCEASNEAGKTTRSLKLKVYKAPVFLGDKYEKRKARLDTTVKLICKAYGIPKPTITWMKSNKPITFSSSVTLNSEDDSILIKSIKKESNGTYQCIAANILGKNKKTIDLFVQDPPHISPPSSTDVIAQKGEEITLNCEVQAYPAAEIKWFKNRSPYKESSVHYAPNNSSLRLKIDLSSSGEYSCRATNEAGLDWIAINVTVAEAPFFEESEEYIQARKGDNISLSCFTDAVPPANYYWTRDPETELIESDSILTFQNVDDSYAGLYHCYAINLVGDAQKVFDVQINTLPSITAEIPKTHILKKGAFLSLPCYAIGLPIPKIQWLKNGKPLLSLTDENVLEIKYASKEDAGTYTCLAENLEGSNGKEMKIKIEDRKEKE